MWLLVEFGFLLPYKKSGGNSCGEVWKAHGTKQAGMEGRGEYVAGWQQFNFSSIWNNFKKVTRWCDLQKRTPILAGQVRWAWKHLGLLWMAACLSFPWSVTAWRNAVAREGKSIWSPRAGYYTLGKKMLQLRGLKVVFVFAARVWQICWEEEELHLPDFFNFSFVLLIPCSYHNHLPAIQNIFSFLHPQRESKEKYLG